MKPLPAPGLESRRAADFERELVERAQTWIPSWSLDEGQPDFGLALLKIAARYNSEVAERLDVAGNKMALGFLDWLGIPAAAARPARMPVVLKMTDSAIEPVLAAHPIKLQVDVGSDTVTFETETDLQVIPGQLAAVVAADPGADAYYLPPPGLTSLAYLDPLPTAWTLKNFAAPKSKTLQLDPGLGLAAGMLIEIAGQQYSITNAKDDLVTIDPPVPTGDGFDEGAAVAKVMTFEPFGGARNLQEHILYIGDTDLLNVTAKARIEVDGIEAAPKDISWEYWGKSDPEDPNSPGADWRPLTPEVQSQGGPPTPLVLDKPKGSVEIGQIPGQGRWIRARLAMSTQVVTTDAITLRINPSDKPPDALRSAGSAETLPSVDIFVNATASAPADVFLFGQEPHLLDTLYIGSDEAFSKAGATAWVNFELSDGAFEAMTAFDRGSFAGGPMLAGVDKGGALNLFSVDQNGRLTRMDGARPLQPEPKDAAGAGSGGATNYLLTSSGIRPVVWLDQTNLCIAVAAKGDIWVRKEPLIQFLPFFFLGTQLSGTWEYWGAPGGDPDAPIAGMALVAEAGGPVLTVLTAAGLFKGSSGTWTKIPLTDDITSIGTMRSDNPVAVPSEFLLVRKLSNGTFELCTVTAAGNVTARISKVDADVQPFGAVSAGTTVLVAATTTQKLSAWKTGGTTDSVDLGSATLGVTVLDGTIVGGQVTVCSTGSIPPDQVLLEWLPFHAQFGDLLFASLVDILPGDPKGPVAALPGRAFIPGNRKGEVLTASIATPAGFSAPTANFRCAVAVQSPPDPSPNSEFVAVRTGASLTRANVEGTGVNGVGTNSGSIFLWLDALIDRDTSEDDVFLFLTLAARPAQFGTVQSTGDEIDLASALPAGIALLVNDGVNEYLVETKQPITGNRVTVKPTLPLATATPVTYRVSDKARGSVFPSIKLDNSNDSWDSLSALATGIYFPALAPERQTIVAYLNDQSTPPKPQFVAFGDSWTTAPSGAGPFNFAVPKLSDWSQARASPAATAELAWEYWNGTGWWHLPIDSDDTSNLRQSGMITFTIPADLQATEWAGKTEHWIRARLIAGNYGEAVVQVVQGTVPNSNPPQTTQTVVRDTSDLQPPYALSVRVAYALNKPVVPQFVMTQDSGELRDQSDANRTVGPEVEIFTPLSVTLGRLDSPAPPSAPAGDCVPDCACDTGTASTSPRPVSDQAAAPAAPAPATAGAPAIFLGFTSKLIDGPVKLLFVVAKENAYDRMAPLKVDALIGNRFTSIIASDDTRALGETEMLTMDFDVEPMKAELFGQALSWLRVAPSIESTDWQPSIAGVYLNAVWVHAAETMTRELLGSSDGEPGLTVTLARPPLLENSLELRVVEPLGEEELKALTDNDPNSVKTGIVDLPGDWVLWSEVADTDDSGPKDRVYALDETSGTVQFGDGLHGMIPPPGTDGIVAFAYQRTDPLTGGEIPGNQVKARQELNLVSPVESVESVIAADQSAGGVAPETPDHVLEFAPVKLRNRGRAVSARDFEDLLLESFNDVLQARCFVSSGKVRLVVAVRGTNPGPSRAQQREFRRMLLESAPISLGATGALTIDGPRVRHLSIHLKLAVNTLDDAGSVGQQSKAGLVKRFSTEFGGELGEGWPLGHAPSEDDVAEALLDIPGLESIVSISLFELDELDVEQPFRDPVAASDLVMVTAENVRIEFEILEAVA
jgi:hypothetical protein